MSWHCNEVHIRLLQLEERGAREAAAREWVAGLGIHATTVTHGFSRNCLRHFKTNSQAISKDIERDSAANHSKAIAKLAKVNDQLFRQYRHLGGIMGAC